MLVTNINSADFLLERPRTSYRDVPGARTFFGDVRRVNVTKCLKTCFGVKILGDVVILLLESPFSSLPPSVTEKYRIVYCQCIYDTNIIPNVRCGQDFRGNFGFYGKFRIFGEISDFRGNFGFSGKFRIFGESETTISLYCSCLILGVHKFLPVWCGSVIGQLLPVWWLGICCLH